MQTDGLNHLDHLWFKLRQARRIARRTGEANFACPVLGSSYTLLALTEGSGTLVTGGEAFTVTEGTVFVGEPGTSMSLVSEGEAPLTMYVFGFDVRWDRGRAREEARAVERSPLPHAGRPLRIPPVSLAAMCRAAYGSMAGDSGLERFRGQFMFQELLHRVFNELVSERSGELDIALEHLRAYIEQHYYEPLSIKRLAGLSKISPRHLVQMFKDKYDMTPMEYVRTLKMQRKLAAEPAVRL